MAENNNRTPEISVIIPLYNEQDNIKPLYAEICNVLNNAGIPFEMIFVDDGSTDNSLSIIKDLSKRDSRIRFASFSRNFGHEAASSCGFSMVKGKTAVLIDADMQDPPSLIPEMYKKWKEGFEVVYAKRLSRQGETFFKKFTSHIFYKIMNRFSKLKIPIDVGDFRLVDRTVVNAFNRLTERNRFVRGLFTWVGYKQTAIEYGRLPRIRGKTKYNWVRLFLLSIDAFSSFSLIPLRLCIIFGIGTIIFSFINAGSIIIQRIFLNLEIPGYALLTAGMFLLGGIQLMFLGVIGEYIGKIYTEVQGRPLYIIRESSDT